MNTEKKNINYSIIRAYWRFFKLFGIIIFYICKLQFLNHQNKLTYKRISLLLNQWAKTSIKTLGIVVEKKGQVPPDGVLVTSNHRSYIDIPAIAVYLPCSFLAKIEVSRWPVIGKAVKLANTIFVERNNPQNRKLSRQLILQHLHHGISHVVFPEGTSYEGPGLMPFRPGSFKTAAENNIEVVPVSIEYQNQDCAWVGEDTFLSHFLRTFSYKKIAVSIHFGPIMYNEDPEVLKKQCWDWINDSLQAKTALQNVC